MVEKRVVVVVVAVALVVAVVRMLVWSVKLLQVVTYLIYLIL